MTTNEILDALEAGILALRSGNGRCGPRGAGAMAGAALRAKLAAAGLTAGQFATAAGVPPEELDGWLDGHAPVPPWVPAAVRMLALLTPAARHTLLEGAAPGSRARRSHPFSRIEEL